MNGLLYFPARMLALAGILILVFSAIVTKDARATYDGLWVVHETRNPLERAFVGKEPEIWHIYTDKKGVNIYIRGKDLKFKGVNFTGSHAKKELTGGRFVDIKFGPKGFEGTYRYRNTKIPVTGQLSQYFQKIRDEAAKLATENRSLSTQLNQSKSAFSQLEETASDLKQTVSGLKDKVSSASNKISSQETLLEKLTEQKDAGEKKVASLEEEMVSLGRSKALTEKILKEDMAALKQSLGLQLAEANAALKTAQPRLDTKKIARGKVGIKTVSIHKAPESKSRKVGTLDKDKRLGILSTALDRWSLVITEEGLVGYVLADSYRDDDGFSTPPNTEQPAIAKGIYMNPPLLVGERFRTRMGFDSIKGTVVMGGLPREVMIDGEPANLLPDGSFHGTAYIEKNGQAIEIVATDDRGETLHLIATAVVEGG